MKLFLVFVFQLGLNQIWSQHDWLIYFNPVGIDFSNNIEEHSLGIYDFQKNFSLSQDLGIIYRREIANQLAIDLGLGLRKINFNFDYIIHDPFQAGHIVFQQNRFHNRLTVYPHVGFSYSTPRFIFELGFERAFIIYKKTNIKTLFGSIEFFIDGSTGKSANFRIVEKNFFVEDFLKISTPVISINYRLSSKFAIRFTSLFKPYGEFYFYQLDIQGRTPDMPPGNFELNDTRINNKLGYVFLGISYHILNKRVIRD